MDYEIIATLGPASRDEAIWPEMAAAGATGFRLNTSHLSLPALGEWMDRLGLFLGRRDRRFPLVLDLQGSKWRLGEFSAAELAKGDRIELIQGVSTDRKATLPVPHADFFKAAPVSSPEIVLNDAKVRLAVESIEVERITARVTLGGPVSSHKGITFLSSDYRQEELSQKDRAILEQTKGMPGLSYALSYLKDDMEAALYRSLLGPEAHLIAKLERRPALHKAMEMAAVVDEMWLCRGDLGAELGLRAMAEAIYQFTAQVEGSPAPVLMAGQVLEHMTEHATPTRSEVATIYDSLARGYRGLVLSDETAVGKYVVESCRIAAMFKTGGD